MKTYYVSLTKDSRFEYVRIEAKDYHVEGVGNQVQVTFYGEDGEWVGSFFNPSLILPAEEAP